MVFHGDHIDPAEEEEMIYIRDQKNAEDDEMQILTPILLESMFDFKSPPDLFRILKGSDKLDDATAVTTDSFSDILLPTILHTPPSIMNAATGDGDDASDISFDSYDRGGVPSPRNVISAGNATSHPLLLIPADIRYEGQVTFSSSSISRTIHLQPRPSARTESIFVPKEFPQEQPIYSDYALADSMSSFGDYGGGAEECKDDGDVSSKDEGFGYVHASGERCKEENYWGIYDGHYGSRDFMDNENIDYALDHASVQSESPVPSAQDQAVSRQPKPSIFEDLIDMFSTCLSCTEGDWSSRVIKSEFTYRTCHEGGFGPGDYGVSPAWSSDSNPTAIIHSNYAGLAAVHRPRAS